MKIKISVVYVVLTTLLVSGCGTFMAREKHTWNPSFSWIYPAAVMDFEMVLSGGGIYQTGDCNNAPRWAKIYGWCVVAPLFAVDLPFSLVADTLFLPKDRRFLRSEKQKEIRLSLSAPVSPEFRVRLVSFSRSPGVVIRDEVSNLEYNARQMEFIPCEMCVSNELQLWSFDSEEGIATFRKLGKGEYKYIQQIAAPLPRAPQTGHSEGGR